MAVQQAAQRERLNIRSGAQASPDGLEAERHNQVLARLLFAAGMAAGAVMTTGGRGRRARTPRQRARC